VSSTVKPGPVVRPGILEIAPYVGGESKVEGVDRVIRLASNEGALGPSPKAIAAYQSIASQIHRYPDGHSGELRRAIAEAHDLDAARIVCGTGSDEIITLLARIYAGPGDEVLYSRHGFLMYPIAAKSVGATPIAVPEINLTADVDALLAAVTPRTRLVFLANPNNPTGTYLPVREIDRLHAGLPPHVVLVLDAAYAEYVTQDDYDAGVALVDRSENVIMLRTFSKIYAMGGLRLGWGYAPATMVDVLNRIRGVFNICSAGQAAGAAAVADRDFLARSVAHNETWRDWTQKALEELGLVITPSVANFLLVRFPDAAGHTAENAWDALKARGILTRKMTSYGLPSHLRITIGTADEMQATLAAIAEFLRP
jgi:histidinol-phosphate aminotransferase